MPELILALDVGTTTARAAVVAPDGSIAGLASAPLRSAVPAPGRAEQDPLALWRAALRVMRGALAAAGRAASDLAAVGLTSQRASAVLWDRRNGRPVSPMVLWSDLRGAERARYLQAQGFLLAPQQPATKLEALATGSGACVAELAWGAADSWILWNLTGGATHVTDRSQAWPTGYLGLGDLEWNETLIERQGLAELAFPRLVDTWGVVGATQRRWLGAEVPIAADVADQQAALIAHGETPGAAKITWGTSGTFDVSTGGPVFAGLPGLPPLIVSSCAGTTQFCIEGMILSAGSALDWLRRAFALGSPERLSALAAAAPDSGGVAFLPALQGLGAPHGEATRLGRLAGLSAAVERPHIARAAFEGLAFRAREIVERAEAAGVLSPGARLGVDGGLSRSPVFLQVVADLLSRPIEPLATPEATLMGAAIAAARGAGLACEADLRKAIRPRQSLTPQVSPDEAAARFDTWRTAVHPT
ncbi:MAG TPA: FGGY family carbohydrate kinase [Caulobacteraceae bacterium]|jgi:glycerol kinase